MPQPKLSWLTKSNLVGLEGSFLRASPAGIKDGIKKEETLESGQGSLPQNHEKIFTLGNKPQNNTARLYRPLWFQSCRNKIDDHSIIFDNPGPYGQESRTYFVWKMGNQKWETIFM